MLNGLSWALGEVKQQLNVIIPTNDFVYTCRNLHEIPHGDEAIHNMTASDVTLRESNVRVATVTGSKSNCPLQVYDSTSHLVDGICRKGINMDSLRNNLFGFLFEFKKEKSSRDSGAVRVDFGLNQVQPTSKTVIDKAGMAHRLPHCNLNTFHQMDATLQAELKSLLLYFQNELHEKDGMCTDKERTQFVHDLFNEAGWCGPKLGWEYINISLRSAGETLHKHFDSKNDRRNGYNHTTVYSYLHTHAGQVYRIVIIMTFRASMGSFMDTFRHLHDYEVGIADSLKTVRSPSKPSTLKKEMQSTIQFRGGWHDSVFKRALKMMVDNGRVVKRNNYYSMSCG